jgi:long-chain acyl-CoA synthetase
MYDRVVFAKVRKAFGGRLRYAISGGAAMSVEVGEFIDALGIPVYEGYGLSETSPIVSANHPGVRRLGSVGKPIPGVRVELEPVDTEDRSSGEIVVYGHCVMQGYHGLPEENARVFTPSGGFRTGDIGRFDEDGFLYITGRVKEQYKLENGKYVVPTPIEEHLKLSPFIVNAMVYGHNRPFNVALIVPDLEALRQWADHEGIAAEGEALLRDERARAKISDEIAAHSAAVKGYERIRDFVLLGEDFTPENGLLTPTLKVKRRDVLDRYGGDIAALYG